MVSRAQTARTQPRYPKGHPLGGQFRPRGVDTSARRTGPQPAIRRQVSRVRPGRETSINPCFDLASKECEEALGLLRAGDAQGAEKRMDNAMVRLDRAESFGPTDEQLRAIQQARADLKIARLRAREAAAEARQARRREKVGKRSVRQQRRESRQTARGIRVAGKQRRAGEREERMQVRSVKRADNLQRTIGRRARAEQRRQVASSVATQALQRAGRSLTRRLSSDQPGPVSGARKKVKKAPVNPSAAQRKAPKVDFS